MELMMYMITVYVLLLVVALVRLLKRRLWVQPVLTPYLASSTGKSPASRFLMLVKPIKVFTTSSASPVLFLIALTAALLSGLSASGTVPLEELRLDHHYEVPHLVLKISGGSLPNAEDVVSRVSELLDVEFEDVNYSTVLYLEGGASVQGLKNVFYAVIVPEHQILEVVGALRGVCVTSCIGQAAEDILECVRREDLLTLRVSPVNTLIPAQFYLGSEPVQIPPENVLVCDSLETALALTGGGVEIAGGELVVSVASPHLTVPSREELSKLRGELGAEAVWFVRGSTAVFVSEVVIPTTESVAAALLSSVTSALAAVATYASLVPYLRRLRDKLVTQGLPPWSFSLCVLAHSTLTLIVGGVAGLLIAYLLLRDNLTLLNSVITVALTWVPSVSYVEFKLGGGRHLRIRMPERYVLKFRAERSLKVEELVELIKGLIRGLEFFVPAELEVRVFGNEAVIHSRLLFTEGWGSGLDMTVTVVLKDRELSLYLSTNPWGVEEISEKLLESMVSVATSRIVGGVRSWALSRLQ